MRATHKPPQTTVCRCGVSWTGTVAMHCSGCHRTFANIAAFDEHRAGHKPRNGKGYYRPSGRCYNPADSGMRKKKGRWGFPTT